MMIYRAQSFSSWLPLRDEPAVKLEITRICDFAGSELDYDALALQDQ